MYPYILKNVVYPIAQFKYPLLKYIMQYQKLMEKTQWWTTIELERFQRQRLQVLLNHAYKNVPYYNRLFKKAGIKPSNIKDSSDLQKLPILTKEIIRKNLNDLTARNYTSNKFIPSATSGSSGEPIKFFIDTNWNAWNMVAAYREWSWAGYNIGDRMAYLWGAPQDISRQIELKFNLLNLIHRTIYLDSLNITEKKLDNHIKILKNFKPKVINAYASAIFLMALYIQKKRSIDIQPEAILTSCEMLFKYQREIIEEAFNCEIFDYYSGRDTTFHAGECAEHTGYHMAIENAVVEFLKENQPVSRGELGKIIITDLSNYTMPFIRYEIGDLGIYSDEKCPCGRGLPLMKEVAGRIRDIISTKEGKFITGAFFSTLFYDKKGNTKGVKQYQIIQKTKNVLLLKLVKGEDYSQGEIDKIIEKINKQCGDISIEIEVVDYIPPTPSGKYRSIVSEVEIDI